MAACRAGSRPIATRRAWSAIRRASYVASAYAFGARDFDTSAALQSLDRGASVPGTLSGGHPVREWIEPWLAQGYVPDQPSITLEYATDDFGIAQFAQAAG